ncbi:hypothetical protein PDJAM_G00080100 [Pangasius djambal]|uniref:Uncharacterized protein n=1 Tax=Pangasius djambal TaxID=1691987 RepID=A0ACC5Z547_9TELE|nr:hypothetical protein [Pangasius djambal]
MLPWVPLDFGQRFRMLGDQREVSMVADWQSSCICDPTIATFISGFPSSIVGCFSHLILMVHSKQNSSLFMYCLRFVE